MESYIHTRTNRRRLGKLIRDSRKQYRTVRMRSTKLPNHFWQQKIVALDQEINTLIDFSNRLTGQNRAPAVRPIDPIDILRKTTLTGTVTPAYDFRNESRQG